MKIDHGRIGSLVHVGALIAAAAALTFSLLAVPAPQDAQAAGEWTTGVLTDNSVHDGVARVSATHLVWVQAAGAVWQVELRTLSSGETTTITTVPSSGEPPLLSIAGDYVTIWVDGAGQWQLYKISTGTLETFPIAPGVARAYVFGTDGAYVIGQVDDGTDYEVVAYDIAGRRWASTNNTILDAYPSIDAGRIVWETLHLTTHSVMFSNLATGSQETLVTQESDAFSSMMPRIHGNWVGYHDIVEDKLCLYRLSDGLIVVAGSSPQSWVLTDKYAFWTQIRPGGLADGSDLYVMKLADFTTTRLTSDTRWESGLAADGLRLVYFAAPGGGYTGDLMVVDMGVSPATPYRLAQNVTVPSFGGFPSISGNMVVASLYDGHDFEICYATWSDGEPSEPTEPTAEFSDVPSSHPYHDAIYYLAEEEVILGFEDGTFRPDDPVTRQQFAKMIVKSLKLTVTGTEVCPFTDVATQIGTDPFYPSKYVAVCAAEGITQGKTPTTFDPASYITHQQLITMVVRSAELPDPPSGYTPSFSASQFSLDEHYQNARKAAYAGLLDGLLGIGPTYNFLASSTRGECAQLLYNLAGLD